MKKCNKTKAKAKLVKTIVSTLWLLIVLGAALPFKSAANTDKSALAAAIEFAGELTQSDYSASFWSNIQSAKEQAVAVNQNLQATQQEVDTATVSLIQAIKTAEIRAADKKLQCENISGPWDEFEAAQRDAWTVKLNPDMNSALRAKTLLSRLRNASKAVIQLGDANRDGKVSTADAIIVLKIASGSITPDADLIKHGNVNQDEGVTIIDALWILQRVSERREHFIYQSTPYDQLISGEATLMCIGDSLTELGYGYAQVILDNLHSVGYEKAKVIRNARSGYTVGAIYPLVDDWIEDNPDCKLFTILLGTNDSKTIENWFKPWETKYYYFSMIRKIQQKVPEADVRICQIPYILPTTTDDTFLPADKWEINKDKVNQTIRCMARRFGMPDPPDLYQTTFGQESYYVPDGLHFSYEGYFNIAPDFTMLLKKIPSYEADNKFLEGRSYTITTNAVQSSSYPEQGNKLTRGTFSYAWEDQIGYSAMDNGGPGSTITVEVEFDFEETVLINDLLFINGSDNSAFHYAPDSITISRWEKSQYVEQVRLTAQTENSADNPFMGFFNMYTPDEPFSAQKIKITFEKTFTDSSQRGDWLFLGEISATVLKNYK